MAQALTRDDVVLAALFAHGVKGFDFTVGDVAEDLGTTRHGIARIVGDKTRLLHDMDGYYTGRLLESLDGVLKEREPTPEKLFHFLHMFLDEEGDVPRFPARPATVAALREACHVRLSGLIARGVADGSIVGCEPDSAATLILRVMERFHTWGTSTLTPDMIEEGATPGYDTPTWQHFDTLNEKNFASHWVVLRRALGIDVATKGELSHAGRYK